MNQTQPPRITSSPYMQWAKSHVHVRYNLAASGVTNCPLSMLPVNIEDLEITGDSYYGYAPLQKALSSHCGVSPDRIFSTIGTSLANHIAMAVLLEPGDEIIVEHPTYELLLSTARYLGAVVKRFHRSAGQEFRIDPGEIEHLITPRTKLIVLTNLHNPSSTPTDEETLQHIGDIARQAGVRVLVDEVYLDAAFEQAPKSAIHLGNEFIVTSSLTKVYGLSGLRCGWVLAEPPLVERMWHLNDLFEVIPAHPAERLSVIALRHLPSIRTWAQALLSENHRTAREILRPREDIEWHSPGYGTVMFVRLRSGRVAELNNRLMDRYQSVVAPGEFFEMPGYFRIGLGAKPELFREGMENLSRALDELN